MLEGEGNEKWAMAHKLGCFIKSQGIDMCLQYFVNFSLFRYLVIQSAIFPFCVSFFFSSFILFDNNKMPTFLFAFCFLYEFFFLGILLFVAEFIRYLRLSSSVFLVSNEFDDSFFFFISYFSWFSRTLWTLNTENV